ncbi:hypothetical protein D3C72_1916790 [compost metagenome]
MRLGRNGRGAEPAGIRGDIGIILVCLEDAQSVERAVDQQDGFGAHDQAGQKEGRHDDRFRSFQIHPHTCRCPVDPEGSLAAMVAGHGRAGHLYRLGINIL